MLCYILYSKHIDKFYIGVSFGPKRRLLFHNTGRSGSKSAFTKRASDWKIVFLRKFTVISDAKKY